MTHSASRVRRVFSVSLGAAAGIASIVVVGRYLIFPTVPRHHPPPAAYSSQPPSDGIAIVADGDDTQDVDELQQERDIPQEVITRTREATVRVVNLSRDVSGSGVVIHAGARQVYIMTAAHLAGVGDRVDVILVGSRSDGRVTQSSDHGSRRIETIAAEVVANSSQDDLAVLRITYDGRSLVAIPPLDSGATIEGPFPAVAAGFEDEQGLVSFVDVISSRRIRRSRNEQTVKVWQGKNAGFSGQSGGPLVDRRGVLVGLRSGMAEGNGYYGHCEAIERLVKTNELGWLMKQPF